MRFAIFALDTFMRATKRPALDALKDTQRALDHISNRAAFMKAPKMATPKGVASSELLSREISEFLLKSPDNAREYVRGRLADLATGGWATAEVHRTSPFIEDLSTADQRRYLRSGTLASGNWHRCMDECTGIANGWDIEGAIVLSAIERHKPERRRDWITGRLFLRVGPSSQLIYVAGLHVPIDSRSPTIQVAQEDAQFSKLRGSTIHHWCARCLYLPAVVAFEQEDLPLTL